MKKFIIDCKSGEAHSVPLTASELQQLDNERAKWDESADKRAADDIRRQIAATDVAMGASIEGLINVMVSRGAIYMNELPPETVQLMADRAALRGKL